MPYFSPPSNIFESKKYSYSYTYTTLKYINLLFSDRHDIKKSFYEYFFVSVSIELYGILNSNLIIIVILLC